MPRRRRVDFPGAVHHLWSRGVDRRSIFVDDRDRFDLRELFSTVFPECQVAVPGWVFLDNHLHVIVRTGEVALSAVMQRLLSRYAVRFNRRHERSGHLFQGRFGSRLVEDDADLMTLVRYVHRNPIKAGVVRDTTELERYRWSGHAALMGRRPPFPFESLSLALGLFSADEETARRRLLEWMSATDEEDPLETLVRRVCGQLGVSERDLAQGLRTPAVSQARTLICRSAVQELRLGVAEVGRRLGVSKSAVSQAIRRRLIF